MDQGNYQKLDCRMRNENLPPSPIQLKYIFPAGGLLKSYPVKKISWNQREPSDNKTFIRVDNRFLHNKYVLQTTLAIKQPDAKR